MSYTKNLIQKLENIIVSSDARFTYKGSNLEREVASSKNDAIHFCVQAHAHQFRKDGEPYFLHPIRVASYAALYINGYNEALVRNICLLHDVIEDTDITESELEDRFGDFVSEHVVELTNVYTKLAYPSLNRKARKERELDRLASCSNLTKQIKLLDRIDNLNSTQLAKNVKYLDESRAMLDKLGGLNNDIDEVLLAKIKNFEGFYELKG